MANAKSKILGLLKKGVAWLATESEYVNRVKRDVESIAKDMVRFKSDIKVAKQELDKKRVMKNIKNALLDDRRLGRSERKYNRLAVNIEKFLHQHQLNGKEFLELETRLHIEAGKLIALASFYGGSIKTGLINLKNAAQKGKVTEAERLIADIETQCDELLKWISSDVIDTERLEEMLETA